MNEFERMSSEELDGGGTAVTGRYRDLGEEVTSVLTAAEEAAARIRETAALKAEATRRAAEEAAAAAATETDALRADADRYSRDARAAADAYAEEERRSADDAAAKIVERAEEQAAAITEEAARRRDELAASMTSMEDRIASMASALHRQASELEHLVPADGRPSSAQDEQLDQALTRDLLPET